MQLCMLGIGNRKLTMKNNLVTILFCLFTLTLFGQYDSKEADEISRFRPGAMWFFTGLRPAKLEKAQKYDRLIFDLTYNDWSGDVDPFQNSWASIGLNTNFMFDIPLTKGNKISLGIGASHQYINIRHDNLLIADELAGTTTYYSKDSLSVFDKSTFGSNVVAIPLEIRFRNESWRHFKLHFGGKIGYQLNAFSRTVDNSEDTKDINKKVGFPDENKLVYSAHVRLGLRNWAFYGSYNFNTLFSNKNSTQLNLLQFGISISLF